MDKISLLENQRLRSIKRAHCWIECGMAQLQSSLSYRRRLKPREWAWLCHKTETRVKSPLLLFFRLEFYACKEEKEGLRLHLLVLPFPEEGRDCLGLQKCWLKLRDGNDREDLPVLLLLHVINEEGTAC